MGKRLLRCFVRGRDDRWEAMCIDLDITVEATSRREVVARLEDAIASYVATAMREDDVVQTRRLLGRRAPWHVRAGVAFSAAFHMFLRSRSDGDLHGSFDVACPA